MRRIVGIISLWLPAIFLLLICGEVALRYPCNHGAGFYCYLYPVSGLLILSSIFGFVFKGPKIGFYLSALCLGLIFATDLFNVYVDYDVWTSRGMPNWGCPTFLS